MHALLLFLALAAPSDRVVTGTGLRLRAAPDPSAAVVEKAPLGTVLPCVEESKPVTVGSTTAPFCKAKLPSGKSGWYFTALTEPLAADKNAQLAQIAKRAEAALDDDGYREERWPDVYEIQSVLKSLPGLAARIEEARFVAKYASAFTGDPRVGRDDSQGPRMNNEVFEKLLVEAKGKPEHELAAWTLYQHGMGGECEGDAGCVMMRLNRTACRYLEQFPSGAHAKSAVDDVIETAEGQREFMQKFPLGKDEGAKAIKAEARAQIAKAKKCVEQAKSGDVKRAQSALDALDKALQ